MNEIEALDLLKNPDVIKEIHKHLWLESEKAGYDIGLAWAAEDWMNRYAPSWLDCHMPGQKISNQEIPAELPRVEAPDQLRQNDGKEATPAKPRKRRAKSYINF